MLFTNYECPQTTSKEKFYVECSYIAYVLSGRRIFHKNSKSWELKEGTCVFVKKGSFISEKPEHEGWCVMVFFIPDHFLKQVINEFRRSSPPGKLPVPVEDMVLPLDVNELSKSFFVSMLPYFAQSPPPPENLLELKFKELVLSLFTNQNNKHFLSYLNNFVNETSPSVAEVMQNNFAFNLTLKEFAKLACRSLPTFKRDFKKVFNSTPAKWVLKKKLELARELLEDTSKSIAEICYECGFENQTHFSRVFKEKTGTSPSQFRTKQIA